MNTQSITDFISGKKSYLCVAAYLAYQVGLAQKWWTPNHTFEVSLIAGFGASVRHAIQKVNDDVNDSPDTVETAPPVVAPQTITITVPHTPTTSATK